jgi:hypothetical protein
MANVIISASSARLQKKARSPSHACLRSGDPKTAQGKLSCYQQPTCAALP